METRNQLKVDPGSRSASLSCQLPQVPFMTMEEEVGETQLESQVYMACIMQGHRIGVAYYDSNARQLFVLEVWEESSGEFPLIELVKYQAKPNVIYASTKTEESFLSALKRSERNEEIEVKLMRSSLFSYEQAWHRDAIAKSNGSPEKLFVLLDMYEIMCEFHSEIETIFEGKLEAVEEDATKIGEMDGTVHHLASYVINYMKFYLTINQL
ncbi:hypothetical protein M5K25_013980 [Dendrobium thyrsiflorum]|uniref:Exocyst complex subunit Exo70 C-terminal domain-containing protein n=1 Tax=Dendrobium thyrsiflorum TaxID=117978 RepID=A0ABD0UV86_DENTH